MIRRVASKPSIPGIGMPVSTVSGRVRLAALDGLRAVVGFGYDVLVRAGLEGYRESGPHQGLVLCDQDADFDPGLAVTSYDRVHAKSIPCWSDPAKRARGREGLAIPASARHRGCASVS